jgi:hypothetical protein
MTVGVSVDICIRRRNTRVAATAAKKLNGATQSQVPGRFLPRLQFEIGGREVREQYERFFRKAATV